MHPCALRSCSSWSCFPACVPLSPAPAPARSSLFTSQPWAGGMMLSGLAQPCVEAQAFAWKRRKGRREQGDLSAEAAEKQRESSALGGEGAALAPASPLPGSWPFMKHWNRSRAPGRRAAASCCFSSFLIKEERCPRREAFSATEALFIGLAFPLLLQL